LLIICAFVHVTVSDSCLNLKLGCSQSTNKAYIQQIRVSHFMMSFISP